MGSRRAVGSFPLREPVSTTLSIALKFRHASAALWADQIDD